MSSEEIPGRLLIHVAFHHVPERVQYLQQLLRSYGTYRFSHVDVVVDTNCSKGAEVVSASQREAEPGERLTISVRVHDDLTNPLLLTWAHREAMREQLEHYEFFMYSEDDILVPWEALVAWHRDTAELDPKGFLRGFLRVETTPEGRLVSTDLHWRGRPALETIGGRRYFYPYRPYQAFWIHSQAQMCRFVGLDAWWEGREGSDVQAAAAGGMNFVIAPGADERPRKRRYSVLIPVDERDVPLPESFIHHLPNNYVVRHDGTRKSPQARFPVEELNRSLLWYLARGRWPR